MSLLRTFFELDANRIVLNFAHGLIFFLIGFGILLKSKHWSELTLAKSLPLLGLFGLLNAFGDWGLIFLPIQDQVFSDQVMGLLWVGAESVLALSYAFLLGFGCRLAADTWPRLEWLPRLVPVAYILWLGAVIAAVVTGRVDAQGGAQNLAEFEVAYRYGFALTGSFISAWALYNQQRQLRRLNLEVSVPPLRWVGIAIAAHGVAAALSVPEVGFFPASLINDDAFFVWTGLPARLFTGLSGAIIAIFMVVVLDVFDLEIHRRVEGSRRMQAVVDERLRIARDLHDGIIQTLYALGLGLEGVLMSIDTSSKEAKEEIRAIMTSLDKTIKDVRGYILKLKTPSDEISLDEQLRMLQKELQREARIPIRLRVDAVQAGIIPSEDMGDILLAVREGVSNALRHARASHVEIFLELEEGRLLVGIRDDGVGFDPQTVRKGVGGEHLGLDNMAKRAESVGGRLMIDSRPAGGTTVVLEIPLGPSMTPGKEEGSRAKG